jgi:hypothetical protein
VFFSLPLFFELRQPLHTEDDLTSVVERNFSGVAYKDYPPLNQLKGVDYTHTQKWSKEDNHPDNEQHVDK